MKTFEVEATVYYHGTVDAESEEEARDIAQDLYELEICESEYEVKEVTNG